jgi:glycerol-3-phosphate acyltransferase PlsX
MGGERAPECVVEGVARFVADDRATDVGLVGRPEVLRPLLGGMPRGRVEVIPATEVIEDADQPALAVRRKPDSSIAVGLSEVKAGRGDAFLSCGNTGALMAGGLFAFGRLPGVRRPALGSPFPDLVHPPHRWFMLDIGANMDATATDLCTYAVLGSVYARLAMGVERPRVALLNVGTEPHKGNEVAKKAHELLRDSGLEFAGNIEARQVFAGPVDVVVCDGFVGNIVLKSVEGLAAALAGAIREELMAGPVGRAGALLVRSQLRRAMRRLDYTAYGGAPLFGLAGLCVKCHGSSGAEAVSSGLRLTRDLVSRGLLPAMATALADLPRRPAEPTRPAEPAGPGWQPG